MTVGRSIRSSNGKKAALAGGARTFEALDPPRELWPGQLLRVSESRATNGGVGEDGEVTSKMVRLGSVGGSDRRERRNQLNGSQIADFTSQITKITKKFHCYYYYLHRLILKLNNG